MTEVESEETANNLTQFSDLHSLYPFYSVTDGRTSYMNLSGAASSERKKQDNDNRSTCVIGWFEDKIC